jgi:hypothetical protein
VDELMKVPFGISTIQRLAAGISLIPLKNRYLENNPILTDSVLSAISRPAMRKFAEVGVGPVRSLYNSPGNFSDDMFVVSNTSLYRLSKLNATSALVGSLGTNPYGDVSWAATAAIGTTPAHLFIAEGSVLWLYTENGEAGGTLAFTGVANNGDVVRIDTVYYQFTSGSVNAGAPLGTAGAPWLVAIGITTVLSIDNLAHAINGNGTPGTTYTTTLAKHLTVQATKWDASTLYVNAIVPGAAGNAFVTTETGANTAWSTGGTLTGGGAAQLRQVMMPNDVGAVSVAFINGYVIVVPVQSKTLNTIGKFYWIDPGETIVDPLNFATAERAPDGINQVGVFGNMFWLFGAITTEPWVTTGDALAPMERYQSILFDRGSWEGTAVQVKDSLIVTDEDGGVFQISGGQKRISRPDIEARIRKAMVIEAASGV